MLSVAEKRKKMYEKSCNLAHFGVIFEEFFISPLLVGSPFSIWKTSPKVNFYTFHRLICSSQMRTEMCKKRKSACKFEKVLHLLELVKAHFAYQSIFKWVDHLRTGSAGLRPASPEKSADPAKL